MNALIKAGILTFAAAQYAYSDEQQIFYKDDNGRLTLTYQTYLDGAPGLYYAFIRGRFDLQDTRTGENAVEWDESKHYRICIEYGTEQNYLNMREKLRWVRYGSKDYWEQMGEHANRWSELIAGEFHKFC